MTKPSVYRYDMKNRHVSKTSILLLVISLLLMQSCSSGKSEVTKIADEGTKFLTAFYVDGNVDMGFNLMHTDARIKYKKEDFKTVLDANVEKFGKAKSFTAKDFILVPDKKAAMLFFDGHHEKQIVYHRVVLMDENGTFKVAGTYFQPVPYGDKYSTKKPIK